MRNENEYFIFKFVKFTGQILWVKMRVFRVGRK